MNTIISIRRLLLGASCVPIITGMCFPNTFSGTVVDKDNNNTPIPGVLVSVGHTTCRTLTDAQGHFTIDTRYSNLLTSPPLLKPSMIIRWDRQKRCIDFSHAPSIKAFSIFNLNGTRLFSEDIKNTDRVVRIPAFTHGVFLIKALLSDTTSFFLKWNALGARGMFGGPLVPGPKVAKTAAKSDETPLLFRHDDYLPFDMKIIGSAHDLVFSMKPDPSRFLFDKTKIHSYSFAISHEDSLFMERNALKEEFVPAEFSFDNTSFGKVGLRFKGSQSNFLLECFDSLGRITSSPLCAKVSMKVKFDKYNDSARFYSVKRLNFHAMSDDDSKMHEMLSYQLFRDMGIYASRSAYAKLYVNGSLWGLFLAAEELDGRFTKSRWPLLGDGNLYKDSWPNSADSQYYKGRLQTNNSPGDTASTARMVNFTKAVIGSSKQTFVQDISPFMDLDYWLRYIAVDRAIYNDDGFTLFYCDQNKTQIKNHNFYFYEEENPGGKFWILPWDLSATLTKTDIISDNYDIPEWNVVPKNCDPLLMWIDHYILPPNCDKLIGLTAATLWNGFVSVGEQLLAACFKADRLKQKIDTFATLIKPVVAQDKTLDMSIWRSEVITLRNTMDFLNKKFDDHIHNRTPSLDTTGFGVPFPDSGFLYARRVNNFEFKPVTPISSWSQTDASRGSTISLTIDTSVPLWGKSDLRCSFVFVPIDTPAMYVERATLSLFLKMESNFRHLKRIRMHLKADVTRYCDVFLMSKSYAEKNLEDPLGWWSFAVTTVNKQFIFDMTQLAFPPWNNQDNLNIRDTVLTAVQGLGINIGARFNNAGKLAVVPDSGNIRIDNIIFEF